MQMFRVMYLDIYKYIKKTVTTRTVVRGVQCRLSGCDPHSEVVWQLLSAEIFIDI